MTSERLIQLKAFLPIIAAATGEKMSMCIFDTKGEVIGFEAGEIPIPYKKGQIEDLNAPEYAEILQSIKTGKVIHNKLDRAIYGIAMEGDIIPIIEQGKVVGVLVTSFSTEHEEQVKEKSDTLKNSILEVDASVKQIGRSSEELSAVINNIQEASQRVEEKIKETSATIKVVTNSAARSNILALNASIEAARAGEAGRGFAVVASEMGKFSKESGELAKKIENILQEMVGLVDNMRVLIDASNTAANSQTEVVEEIINTLSNVSADAMELAGISHNN